MDTDDRDELRDEITRLLAAALASDLRHEADIERRDQMHVAEMDRRDELHIAEIGRRDVLLNDEAQRRLDRFEHERELIQEALETRDLIGQAKGIIIASMRCSSDEAFVMLRKQSRAENRKLNDIAAGIVTAAQRRH